MASKLVNDHKYVNVFTNEESLIRVVYDFDEDAGALGSSTPLTLFTANDDLVITEFYVRGITVLDSAADGTSIDVGVAGGTTDILLNGVVEASFSADALIQPTIVEGTPNVLPLPLYVPKDDKVEMLIVDEALTSGKCEFVFKVCKFK